MKTAICLLAVALATSSPALAQTPQSGPAAPSRAPSGVLTPAPVPDVAPGTPATTSPAAVPDQIAPPANTGGPANSTPFSNTPSGLGGTGGGASAGSGTSPNLSK